MGPRGAGTDALILGPRCAGVIHKAGPPSRHRRITGQWVTQLHVRRPGATHHRRPDALMRGSACRPTSDHRPPSTTSRLVARLPDITWSASDVQRWQAVGAPVPACERHVVSATCQTYISYMPFGRTRRARWGCPVRARPSTGVLRHRKHSKSFKESKTWLFTNVLPLPS